VTIWAVMRLQQPHMATSMAERAAPATDANATATPPAQPSAPPAPSGSAGSAAPTAAPAPAPPVSGADAPARTDELDRAKAGLEKALADDRDRAAQALREARTNALPIAQAPKPEAAAGGAAANERVVVTQAAPPPPAAASSAPATAGVHGPSVNTQQQNLQALSAQMQAQAAQVAAARAQKEREAPPVAPAEAPRQATARSQPAAIPAPPPPPPEPQAAGEVAEMVTAPPPAEGRAGARRQGFGEAKRDVSALRDRAESAPVDALAPAIAFAEPGGRLRWRIAGGTRIESSSDAGATWNERYTATSRLRAGSAPGIDTAWVVGDGGLVMRFVVPGTWTPVNRPTTAALVGVTASSADAARVTAGDGRVFETSDGGRTWTAMEGAGVPPR
jgi:hypothetical protein